jgi:hypothetical protein
MVKSIPNRKDKIKHSPHRIKKNIPGGPDNSKLMPYLMRKRNPKDNVKHMTHRIKEHIPVEMTS